MQNNIYQFPPILIISEFCASKQVANLCFEHIIIVISCLLCRHKILSTTKYLGSEIVGCQRRGWMICPLPLEDVGLP